MKAFIDEIIEIGLDNKEEQINLLTECGVKFIEVGEGIVKIPVQKITLSEEKMNELFYEVFSDQRISYLSIGGVGCDFAMNITSN